MKQYVKKTNSKLIDAIGEKIEEKFTNLNQVIEELFDNERKFVLNGLKDIEDKQIPNCIKNIRNQLK